MKDPVNILYVRTPRRVRGEKLSFAPAEPEIEVDGHQRRGTALARMGRLEFAVDIVADCSVQDDEYQRMPSGETAGDDVLLDVRFPRFRLRPPRCEIQRARGTRVPAAVGKIFEIAFTVAGFRICKRIVYREES